MFHQSYRGDPYWLRARYSGTCNHCKRAIKPGERIFYFPKGKHVFCDAPACGQAEARAFESAAQDEYLYNLGGA